MFCGHCGALLKENFKFCIKCGNSSGSSATQNTDSSAQPSVSDGGPGHRMGHIASGKSVPTLSSFMEKKKDDRVSRFKKTTKNKTSPNDELPVTINVGLMRYVDEESLLKPARGKSLPLKLRKTADSTEILKLAVGKHSMHNTNEIVNSSSSHYKLLYPDTTEVKTLKETDEPFTLQGYKSELGKPYNRITLYLCSTCDYLNHRVKGISDILPVDDDIGNESENDFEQSKEQTQSKIENYMNSDTGLCRPTAKRFCPDTATASCTISKPSVSCSTTDTHSASCTITRPSASCGTNVITCNIDNTNNTNESFSDSTISSNRASGSQNAVSGYKSVKDIFPHLPDWKILQALQNTEDIEGAVTRLCDDRTEGLCDQLRSYASVITCNDSTPELLELPVDEVSVPLEVDEHKLHSIEEEEVYFKLKELALHRVESGNKIRLKVRRSCIWEDTMAKMKRVKREGLSGLVVVQFIVEPAVDDGGPRKEFFYLVHKHMQQASGLFEGKMLVQIRKTDTKL